MNTCVCGEVLVAEMSHCPACRRSNLQHRKPLLRPDVVLFTLGLVVATVALQSLSDSAVARFAILGGLLLLGPLLARLARR